MTAPANWYPDPSAPHQLRYWDGAQWTQHLSVAPAPVPYAVRPRLLYAPTKRMAIASIATAGCVALKTGALKRLLAQVGPKTRIVIG